MAISYIVANRRRLYFFLKEYENNIVSDIVKNKLKKNSNQMASFDDANNIVYFPKVMDAFNPKVEKTSIGRYIRRQLKISQTEIDDTELSRLSDFLNVKIKTYNNAFDNVDILNGEHLADFYKNTTAHSCMTGRRNLYKIKLWVDNPDRVSLIAIKSGKIDRIDTRALMFLTDSGDRIVSRVYGSCFTEIQAWCKKNKVREASIKDRITLHYNKKIFPYVDWFYFAELDDVSKNKEMSGNIILSNCSEFGNVCLNLQTGGFEVMHRCKRCLRNLYRDDVYRLKREGLCYKCYICRRDLV